LDALFEDDGASFSNDLSMALVAAFVKSAGRLEPLLRLAANERS